MGEICISALRVKKYITRLDSLGTIKPPIETCTKVMMPKYLLTSCNTLKHFSSNFYHFCNGYVYTFQFSVILKENKSEGKYNSPES